MIVRKGLERKRTDLLGRRKIWRMSSPGDDG
jgi:hypothetical protein